MGTNDTFVYALCKPCGAVIADGDAHALWHARLGVAIPALKSVVTTLDPATGDPVVTGTN